MALGKKEFPIVVYEAAILFESGITKISTQ
jgi:hypothetical protein